jgi:hypothetical protein
MVLPFTLASLHSESTYLDYEVLDPVRDSYVVEGEMVAISQLPRKEYRFDDGK